MNVFWKYLLIFTHLNVLFYFVGVKHECTWKKNFIFFICIFYFILYKIESSNFIKK